MIRAYSSWKSKIQYLKILEYFLRSIKKSICKTEKFKFFKVGIMVGLLSLTHLKCTCNCIALTIDPTFSHTPWLVHYVQCLHVIGQTTFRSLPSAGMKTGKQSQNKSWQGCVREKWHVWPPYLKYVHLCTQYQRSLLLQYHDWGVLEQGTEPPTAPRAPQHGCPLLKVCVHLGWVKCR